MKIEISLTVPELNEIVRQHFNLTQQVKVLIIPPESPTSIENLTPIVNAVSFMKDVENIFKLNPY